MLRRLCGVTNGSFMLQRNVDRNINSNIICKVDVYACLMLIAHKYCPSSCSWHDKYILYLAGPRFVTIVVGSSAEVTVAVSYGVQSQDRR